MKVTGERLTLNAGMYSELEWEHLHRYLAVAELVKGKTVLDAACGTGYGSKILGEKAERVYGIDVSAEAVEYARENNAKDNVSFYQMSVTEFSFDVKFDAIVSFETIEHIDEEQQKAFLTLASHSLKDDGILIISTPDKNILTKIISHNYRNPYHVREFSYMEFEAFLKGYFKNVHFYYQNLLETSVISDGCVEEYKSHASRANIVDGKYIIALCSQKETRCEDISGVYLPDVKNYYLEKYSGAYAALFIDTGKGYNEEEKLVQKYIVNEKELNVCFDISGYENIKRIRFDPCEQPCRLEITGLKANVGGIRLVATNAFKLENEWYFFATTHPSFEVCGEKLNQIKKLEFGANIEFLPYYRAEQELYALIGRYEESIKEKEASEEQLKSTIDENRKVISNLNEEIERLNLEEERLLSECGELREDAKRLHEEAEQQRVDKEHLSAEISDMCERERTWQAECAEFESVLNLNKQKLEQAEQKWKESQIQIETLEKEAIELREKKIAVQNECNKEIDELKGRIRAVTAQEEAFKQELDQLKIHTLPEKQLQVQYLEQALYDIKQSTCWKITAPIRFLKDGVKKLFSKRGMRLGLRRIYLAFPLPFAWKKGIKNVCFTILTPFIKNTETYKIWANRNAFALVPAIENNNYMAESAGTYAEEYVRQIMRVPFKEKDPEYVEDTAVSESLSITAEDVKYLAFYLPQYHPFKENDEWWGAGFTEWTNVTKAVPQFVGHYQPRLTGGLGYYDLRNKDTIAQQMALARKYGIYGWCIYYYWFDGKTLMEGPLKTIAENPELNLPFCLCWANENWSRRWDGKENDILIAQNYGPDFPRKFISDVKKYMRDARYIRIEGRPVLIVYNANQIPDLENTLKCWRVYGREADLGELYLLAVDFALSHESKKSGFDGFIEFPPHSVYNYSMEDIHGKLSFINGQCNSQVYDYQQIVREKRYLSRDMKNYYKGVTLAWDNTARKPYAATVYHNYSVAAFREWLKDVTEATMENRKREERFVFINAWNEWAEGTYLEPDAKYGYANLKAVRDTLLSVRRERKSIIYVGHDAEFAGAQMLALKTIEELKNTYHYSVFVILKNTGAMFQEFKDLAEDIFVVNQSQKITLEDWVRNSKCRSALCNTVVTGDILERLTECGVACIAMIHEMENVIHQYHCEGFLSSINRAASKIVFASQYVKKSVDKIEQTPSEKAVIMPQGMFLVNTCLNQREYFRRKIREKYHLKDSCRLIIGVGYGYRRKGTDLFLKIAVDMCAEDSELAFMWIGDLDPEMQEFSKKALSSLTYRERIILAGSQRDLMQFYTAADIFLLTSREDPFPSVVMEALYAYLPVVAFKNGGGYEDIITAENGALVPMEDVAAMKEEIRALIVHEELRKAKGEYAHNTITEKYHFTQYVGKLLALLGETYKTVSVIIPNYNYETYLPQRIESVLAQTYPVQEILLLDDSSTDNSRKVILEYEKKYPTRIRGIFNEKNSGNVFEQWKKGLEAAHGEFVWIAEADDLAAPDFLESLICKFSKDVVMAYSESVMIDERGKRIGENYQDWVRDVDAKLWKDDFIMPGPDFISNALEVKNVIPNVSAALFRNRNFSAEIDEAKKYRVAGDWIFYISLLQKGNVAFSSRPLNYHRRHSNSVTTALKARQHYDEICSAQQYAADKYHGGILSEKAIAYRTEAKKYLGIQD